MKVTLEKGFKRYIDGQDVFVKDVEIKSLTYGDMLNIQEDAESLVYTRTGEPILLISETKLAKLSLISQIKRIGDEFAPFDESILDDLEERDGIILMTAIQNLNLAGAQAKNVGKD